MKKKIIMGLFVLATVIGMGFAGTTYYYCGHKAGRTKGSDVFLTTLCSECEDKQKQKDKQNKQDKDYADRLRKLQSEVCTQPDDKLTVKEYNDYDCKTYRENNNNSNNNSN